MLADQAGPLPGRAEPVFITVEGLATYLVCHRAWWLADVLAYAPSDDLLAAQTILFRRERLLRALAITGGGMIALATLFIAAGLLSGRSGMPPASQIASLLLFIFGLMALLAIYRLRRVVRPPGHVDHADREVEAYIPHGPMISTTDRLAGQAHSLLRLLDQHEVIPVVEHDGPGLDFLDLATELRMAALCRLAEVVYDQAVSYGLVSYADQDVFLAWTPALAQKLEDLLDAMRALVDAGDVPRSHNDPSICHTCRVKVFCDQALE